MLDAHGERIYTKNEDQKIETIDPDMNEFREYFDQAFNEVWNDKE